MLWPRQPNALVNTGARCRRHPPSRPLWSLIAACFAVLAFAPDLFAQVVYTVVADLGRVGGSAPLGGVIRGADGALYGTTAEGGAGNCGIVYRLDTTGQLSLVHEFSEPDGCRPVGELALGTDGSLYGVTFLGGDADPQRAGGTIYKIASDGTYTVLYRFAAPFDDDPEPWLVPYIPYAGLTLAPDGFFYGTLRSNDVFRISPDGAFGLLHQFFNESEPQELSASLTLAADGHLYSTSTTTLFIRPRAGSIFRVSLAGDADVLYRFPDFGLPPPEISAIPEGGYPTGELAAGPDGEFYGANSDGGPSVTDRGTIFRLQPDGTLVVLHVFSMGEGQSYPDGAHPLGGLILGTNGHVYGTTSAGGASGNGTIFRVSPAGVFTTLRSFAQDGFAPTKGRLLEAMPGVFYGTAPSASGGVVYQMLVSSSLGISLLAPVGGEKLIANVPTTIQWTANGAIDIGVELSRDGGRSFEPIPECTGLPGSATSCTWTPTGPRTPRARIRVVAHDAGGGSASDVTTRNIHIRTKSK